MTPKELPPEKYSFSGVFNTPIEIIHSEEYSFHIKLETYLQGISQSKSFIPDIGKTEARSQLRESRRTGLDNALQRLSVMEIPEKEHVEEYLKHQHRRGCRPNTLMNSLTTIMPFLVFIEQRGKVHVEEISRKDLEAFIEHAQDRGLKASTISTRLRTLKAFIRFLAERGTVSDHVLSKRMSIKVPDSLPRAMNPDDVKRLLNVIDDTRNRAMVLVLLRTGMRIGELLNTLVREVNFKERKIEVYEAEKTGVGRVVYLSEDARAVLKLWLKKRDSKKAYLFYAQGRETMTYAAAWAMFKKYVDKSGLSHKGYSLHSLRHTFATELLNAGMRLECLQPLLGHSSLEMTRRYARLTDKTREAEYFKAIAIIERGEMDGPNRIDCELPTTSQETELLISHSEELHEHP